jgi:hypothetical protein
VTEHHTPLGLQEHLYRKGRTPLSSSCDACQTLLLHRKNKPDMGTNAARFLVSLLACILYLTSALMEATLLVWN